VLLSTILLLASACGDGDPSSDAGVGGSGTTSGAGGAGDAGNANGGNTASGGSADGGASVTGAGGAGGAGVLFADDFNRPDTTGGLDNGWVVNAFEGNPLDTTFDIESESAYPFYGSSTAGMFLQTIASTFRPEPFDESRLRVAADVRAEGGDYNGVMVLIARSQQTTSSELSDYYFCGTLASGDWLYLMKVEGDTVNDLAISDPGALPLPDGTTSRLTFTLDGDQLTCELSGARNVVVKATDSTFSSGYIGMAGGRPGANWLRFDDFVIEAL
jgi:hypothetical protein